MPKSPLWTAGELELLSAVATSHPYTRIPKEYNRLAKAQGYIPRTDKAIWLKGLRAFGTLRAIDENFNLGTLTKLLGIPRWHVETWHRAGKLKGRKVSGRWVFSDRNIATFTHDYPELMGKADLQALIFLFGAERAIALKEKAKPPMVRPVKHLATGKIYPTMTAAGKELHYSPTHIRRKLQKGEFIYHG